MDKSLSNTSKEKLTATQKIAVTAGSVSALMLVQNNSIEADIVFVDSPISISLGDPSGTSVPWDIDGDGTIDSGLHVTGGCIPDQCHATIYLDGISLVAVGVPLFSEIAIPLVPGFVVGPTVAPYFWANSYDLPVMHGGTFMSGTNTYSSVNIFSDFHYLGFGDNYIGFRFNGDDSELHYGWAEINLDTGGFVTINRWAYEDVAGRGLPVGVPEPISPLMLLGLGAAGLLGFRQRKRLKSKENNLPNVRG